MSDLYQLVQDERQRLRKLEDGVVVASLNDHEVECYFRALVADSCHSFESPKITRDLKRSRLIPPFLSPPFERSAIEYAREILDKLGESRKPQLASSPFLLEVLTPAFYGYVDAVGKSVFITSSQQVKRTKVVDELLERSHPKLKSTRDLEFEELFVTKAEHLLRVAKYGPDLFEIEGKVDVNRAIRAYFREVAHHIKKNVRRTEATAKFSHKQDGEPYLPSHFRNGQFERCVYEETKALVADLRTYVLLKQPEFTKDDKAPSFHPGILSCAEFLLYAQYFLKEEGSFFQVATSKEIADILHDTDKKIVRKEKQYGLYLPIPDKYDSFDSMVDFCRWRSEGKKYLPLVETKGTTCVDMPRDLIRLLRSHL